MRPVASHRVVVAVIVWLAAGGCGERGDEQSAAPQGPGGVPSVQAAEFYRAYSTLSGAELLEKYGAGVMVTGPVQKRVDLGGDAGVQLWLAVDAPGPGHVAVKFRDSGAAAQKQKVAPGEIVAVTCQINGKPADVLFLVDCVLP
ncbi:MAG TPA: hypothetical protein VK698_32255 [Kofleriaceae bacterium]|nr:hypothetical protein [Kofleriaceae bacterium]